MGVLAELTRPATDADVVGGVRARLVAAPASTDEAAALLRAAADLAVVVRGGGTKLDWGAPPRRLDLIVDTHRLTGVVEHAAGDLITVVRAGTTMTALGESLPGQQLALDATPGATVGGTVATAASGPRRMLYGTARDLLIGMTVVRPDGKVAHAGGKVVKNVAGYDLGKLFTGSYGTLGLITECAFRLHPLPAASAVVLARAPDAGTAGRLVAAVLGAQVVPSAVEINAPPDGEVEVAVLVEGSAAGVRERAATLAKLLGGEAIDGLPSWWGAYPWADGGIGLKLTAALSRVPDLLVAARETGAGLTVRGSAGTGVLYAGFAPDASHSSASQEEARHSSASQEEARHSSASREEADQAAFPREAEQAAFPREAEQAASPREAEQAASPREAEQAASPREAEQSVGESDVSRVVEYLRAAATRAGGHAVVLIAPDGVRDRLDLWGPVHGLALMRRVKDQFDPDHRFAAGRFVGGI